MQFQEFTYLSATRLKPSSNKVLMYFIALARHNKYVVIDQKTIMEQLGLTKQTVVSALKQLYEFDIINKIPNSKDNRRIDYFIKPINSWKNG